MDLADETVRERKPLADAGEPVIQGRDVVRHLHDVVERNTRQFIELEEQEVRQRRLGAFDLGREDCLLADVRVKEQGRVGQEGRDAVEPA